VRRTRTRLLAMMMSVTLVAACGGDDDTSSSGSATTSHETAGAPGTDPVTPGETTDAPDGTAVATVPEQPLAEGLVDHVPVADDYDPEAIFRWGYSLDPTSLDPHRGSNPADLTYLSPLYDRLVWTAPSGAYEPMLATSWSLSDDLTVITFDLREGVKFHDGADLDAEAVKTSLDRARGEGSTVAADLVSVVDVRVTGPMQIEIEVSGGAGALFGSLSDRAGMIVSPDAIDDPDLGTHPVGAGPYELSEWRAGDRVIYSKFDGYWDPAVQRVAGMEYRNIPDEQTRLNALQTGELDMMVTSANRVKATLDTGYNALAGLSPGLLGFSVNAGRPPFDDPLVRKALWQAIDRESIANELLEGYCAPQLQFWPANSWAYDQDLGPALDVYAYDPDAARALLVEAGYPDGFEFKSLTSNVVTFTPILEVIQQNFADIGVTMNMEVVDAAQVFALYKVDKTVDGVLEVYTGAPDPSGTLNALLLPSSFGNPGGAASDRVVELAEQAQNLTDQAERAELYHEITAELLEFVPHIGNICMRYRTEAFVPGVSGIWIYASGARDFRGVAITPQ